MGSLEEQPVFWVSEPSPDPGYGLRCLPVVIKYTYIQEVKFLSTCSNVGVRQSRIMLCTCSAHCSFFPH